jgi:hypothetical protein
MKNRPFVSELALPMRTAGKVVSAIAPCFEAGADPDQTESSDRVKVLGNREPETTDAGRGGKRLFRVDAVCSAARFHLWLWG